MVQDVTKKEKRYVGVKETVLFGVANGGQSFGYTLVRMQMTFFLVTVFGIPPEAVSLMILIMGFWDAFNDPIMGAIVDKTRTRFGKLRPYLIFVPIPLGIITTLFFGGAEFLKDVESVGMKIAYMCITYFLWEFVYTIGDIPFWGLSAAISPSPGDRSRAITSARFISSIISGISGPIISIFIDLQKSGTIGLDTRQLFLILGLVGGTIGMGLFSLSGFCTKERVVQPKEDPKLLDGFVYLFKNKPLQLLVAANILGIVGSIADTFTQYFYLFTLGKASYSIIAGIPGTIVGFGTYGFIQKLEKRWSPKQIIIRCEILKAIVSTAIFLAGAKFYTNPIVIVPLMMLWGVFNSFASTIKMVIPTKMIGDTVDYMEWKTGDRGEGSSFSLLTFVGKLTGSLATAVSTAMIPLIGLQEVGHDLVLPENGPVNTRFLLWAIVTIIPAVLNLVSLIPYIFYKLDNNKLTEIHKELAVRHEINVKNAEESNNG